MLASATGENRSVIWSTGGRRIEALDCGILGDINDRKFEPQGGIQRQSKTSRRGRDWPPSRIQFPNL